MSLLSYIELCELVEQGVITGVKPEAINGTSIDVHLGDELICETYVNSEIGVVHLAQRTPFTQHQIKMIAGGYRLAPGEFVLASTMETFNLPADIGAEFRLKSSGARNGVNHAFAGHCDPWWHGSTLTLELKNQFRYHSIMLTPGVAIGQIRFERVTPVPEDRGYKARGRYNGDTSVQGIKA